MRTKKLFNSIFLSFAAAAMAMLGFVLSSTKSFLPSTNAAFTEYTKIKNTLPEYLELSGGVASTQDKSIVLLDGSKSTYTLTIGSKVITMQDSEGNVKNNYGYLPDQGNADEYYLFNFTSSLSLYKDITNKELANLSSSNNLLLDTPIDTFASDHDEAINVTGLGKAPQKLEVNFTLGSEFAPPVESQDEDENPITVEEGLYTLVIPMTVYHTTDGGVTYTTVTEDAQIEYTFMIFNSSTYFTSGLQNATMDNVTSVALSNNSGFSRFYYYNYTTTALPKFSYNPYAYQITINFVDFFFFKQKTAYEIEW